MQASFDLGIVIHPAQFCVNFLERILSMQNSSKWHLIPYSILKRFLAHFACIKLQTFFHGSPMLSTFLILLCLLQRASRVLSHYFALRTACVVTLVLSARPTLSLSFDSSVVMSWRLLSLVSAMLSALSKLLVLPLTSSFCAAQTELSPVACHDWFTNEGQTKHLSYMSLSDHAPFRDSLSSVGWSLGLAMINLSTRFEVSAFHHYKDTKENTKC